MTPNKRDLNITERKVSLEHRHFAFIAAVLKDSKPEAHWDANKRAQWQVTVHRFIARAANQPIPNSTQTVFWLRAALTTNQGGRPMKQLTSDEIRAANFAAYRQAGYAEAQRFHGQRVEERQRVNGQPNGYRAVSEEEMQLGDARKVQAEYIASVRPY